MNKLLTWIIAILVLSSFVSATDYQLHADTSVVQGAGAGVFLGVVLTTNTTFNLTTLYKFTGADDCTNASVFNASGAGAFLGSGLFSGITATLTTPILLNNNSKYYLMYSCTAGNARADDGFSGFPNGTSIGWINGSSYNFGALSTVSWYGIWKVGGNFIIYITPPSIFLANFTPGNNAGFNGNSYTFNSYPSNFTYNTNCYLYINDSLNASQTFAGVTNKNLSFTNNLDEGQWNYYVNCNEATTGYSINSTRYNFTIDRSIPTQTNNFSGIILRYPTANASYFVNMQDNLMLWGFNFTINNVLEWNRTNIQTKVYQQNATIYSKNYTYGRLNGSLWFADAHTAQSIEPYIIDTTKVGTIKFDGLAIETLTKADRVAYSEQTDRYTFGFGYNTPQTEIQIKMPSNCIYQNRDELYKGWFVCGNKWVDFENYDGIDIIVDAKTNIITATSKEPIKDFNFQSVGSLNEVWVNLTSWIFMDNVTSIYSVIEGQQQTFNLTLWHGTDSFATNATFNWNGTVYTTTKTSDSVSSKFGVVITTPYVNTNLNVTHFFNFSINGTYYTTSLTPLTIINVNFSNCSNGELRTLNFTFYNVSSGVNTLVNASSMTGHLTTDFYGSYNLTWGNNFNDGICLYPNTTSSVAETQYQYIIPGCGTRNYYLDTTLNNVTQNLNLYCDSATTQVTFSVKDENDNNVPDVFIYIQKYNVGTATATTTEIIKTDSNGQAIGNIIKFTQAYKFILVYNGVVVKEDSPAYVMLDTKSFRINLGADTYFTNFDTIQGVTCSDVTYTNSTTSFSYTWLDPSNNITQACLEVYLSSNTQHILVNSSCNTSSSGTMTLSIPPPYGSNSYLATGYVYIGSNKFVCGDSASATFDVGWKDYGTESLFLSFLLIVFLITVGLWNPVVAIALMMVGIVLLNILGLFHLDWSWLVGFIILGGLVMFKMRQN